MQQDSPPTGDEWEERRVPIDPALWRMRSTLSLVAEAARDNRRRARHLRRLEHQIEESKIMERVTF